jgi:hypothetical protein
VSHLHKLRIATCAGLGSLALVRAEVANAVGALPSASLQEFERDEVVVELTLPARAGTPESPGDLAREVAMASRHVEVLGVWNEDGHPALPRPRAPKEILDAVGTALDPVALQATVDGVPTAAWAADRHTWRLGVPYRTGLGPTVVAMCEQRGYGLRFSERDVRATLLSIAAA